MNHVEAPFQPRWSKFFFISFQGPCPYTEMPEPSTEQWLLAGRRSSARPPSLLKFLSDRVQALIRGEASFLVGKRYFCLILEDYCGYG